MKKKIIPILILSSLFFIFPSILMTKKFNNGFFLLYPWTWTVKGAAIPNVSYYQFFDERKIPIFSIETFSKSALKGIEFFDVEEFASLFGAAPGVETLGKRQVDNQPAALIQIAKSLEGYSVNAWSYIFQSETEIILVSFDPKYKEIIDNILDTIKLK